LLEEALTTGRENISSISWNCESSF